MIDVYFDFMKKLIPILTVFLSSILFPQTSLGEWKYVLNNMKGDQFFIDYDRIRENNGYVYYWTQSDYKKPLSGNSRSSHIYIMGDCEVFRVKFLSYTFFEGNMGKGDSETMEGEDKWYYPTPNSSIEIILKSVCEKI